MTPDGAVDVAGLQAALAAWQSLPDAHPDDDREAWQRKVMALDALTWVLIDAAPALLTRLAALEGHVEAVDQLRLGLADQVNALQARLAALTAALAPLIQTYDRYLLGETDGVPFADAIELARAALDAARAARAE